MFSPWLRLLCFLVLVHTTVFVIRRRSSYEYQFIHMYTSTSSYLRIIHKSWYKYTQTPSCTFRHFRDKKNRQRCLTSIWPGRPSIFRHWFGDVFEKNPWFFRCRIVVIFMGKHHHSCWLLEGWIANIKMIVAGRAAVQAGVCWYWLWMGTSISGIPLYHGTVGNKEEQICRNWPCPRQTGFDWTHVFYGRGC